MSNIFQISVRENQEIAENHFILTAEPSEKITEPLPGQFFMVSAGNGWDPLLKRPFSLHRWLGGNFQLMYRVVGKATGILKQKNPGDILDIIGPLGNGFPHPKNSAIRPILIAGGIGFAPIYALAESLSSFNPLLFHGARTADELLCNGLQSSLCGTPRISTDDGSSGLKGTVVDLLEDFLALKTHEPRLTLLYACGSKPMLRSLSSLMQRHGLQGYIAMEEAMACGFGTCLGCVVNTTGGYKRVCREGPVFPAAEIIF